MTPQNAFQWLRDNMLPYYPLGVYRDVLAEGYESVLDRAHDRAKESLIAQKTTAIDTVAGLMKGGEA